MILRAPSQIVNKTKNVECKQQISVGGAVRKEILSSQYDSSIVFWRKNRGRLRVRIIGTLSLRKFMLNKPGPSQYGQCIWYYLVQAS